MRRSLWVVCGTVFFLVCLLMTSPAWLVTDILAKQVPELKLGTVTGRAWRGQIDHVQFGDVHASQLQWRFSPVGLFRGVPLAISIASPVKATALLGLAAGDTLKLRDVEAHGKIAELMGIAQLPSMGFDGGVDLVLASARLSSTGCSSIEGTLTLASLLGDIDGISTIAPVSAELSCVNGLLTVLVDENNPNRVRGQVQLMNSGRASGNLTLSPAPGSELFKSLTLFLGAPRNNADFVLRF
ncbi:general secretion pathway protein N [gamma proteobacterium BDW918]|jgi:general secretion pathway protein N|nr:type II secretion system protein N [Zhongshania aliphaticivorans]EIF44527.1 general secretion pathway protein N [gamma proteobacterium BDW918]